MAAGSAMISASLFAPVSLADLDAKRMPKNVAAVAKKPGTKETAPADGVISPPAKATTVKPASKRKLKATSGYQTVPNEQLGLGCSSAE
jgi:hypothetical protein